MTLSPQNELDLIPSKVEAGVEYLNNRFPEWYNKIDLKRLDISSGVNCVVAQLAEKDVKVSKKLEEDFQDICVLTVARNFGLLEIVHSGENYYPELTKQWKKRIEELKILAAGN